MKRNTLLFAIAAIAVVGIAAGLLLAGAGQTGPLQGGIAPSLTPMFPTTQETGVPPHWFQTSLTLECSVLKNFSMGKDGYDDYLELHGRLIDERGCPVVNRMVKLRKKVINAHFFDDLTTVTTGYDGSYSMGVIYVAHSSGKPFVYYAEFAGSDPFLPSRSPDVMGPHV